MSGHNDGGPASQVFWQNCYGRIEQAAPGMTLRDWFAGQAISEAFKVAMNFNAKEASPCPFAARLAYDMADAMLAARDKEPT